MCLQQFLDPIVIILELLWPLVIYPERSSDTSVAIMPLIFVATIKLPAPNASITIPKLPS